MNKKTRSGLMLREEALEDLADRGSGSVTIYNQDDPPTQFAAYAILAGIRARSNEHLFGYFVVDGKAYMITGQPTWLDIEGRFRQLQVERNVDDLNRAIESRRAADT